VAPAHDQDAFFLVQVGSVQVRRRFPARRQGGRNGRVHIARRQSS